MTQRRNWERNELIVAFNLYCKIPFNKINNRHTLIVKLAKAIDRTPSAVAWKLANFASLDPSLIARGVKGAKNTSKLDKVIFNEFANNWENLSYKSEILISQYFKKDIQEEFKPTTDLIFKEGVEREATVKIRVNQSFFRKTVLSSYDFKCSITGINIPQLLIASHIIPWSKDKENRLNPQNGICLNSLHDKAFDAGFITFDNDFKMVISKEIKKNRDANIEKYFLDLEGKKMTLPKRFIPDVKFLEFHNQKIFRK